MKLSIRSTVVILPVVVAVVCAWIASHRRSQQSLAIEHYRTALNSGYDAGPNGLVGAYGVERSRELMKFYSSESPDVVFDGSDRWAQILRVPRAHGVGLGDGYTLYSLRDSITHSWTLPKGTVLKSIAFADEEIVFQIYGRVSQGSFKYTIPDDHPDEYRLQWKPGAPVPQTYVGELMCKEYCIESNRAY